MKYALLVLGVLLLLTGAIWTLQGLDILKGSFMTGQSLWFYIGLACVVVGIAALFAGLRVRTKS